MSDNNNEEEIELPKRKALIKVCVLCCVCFALAWRATYIAERLNAPDYSNADMSALLIVFLLFVGTKICKIWASFCLGVCFMSCLLVLWYWVAFTLRYVRIKKEGGTAFSGKGTRRTAFVRCIASVIISVAVIALGTWLAVRLSLVIA